MADVKPNADAHIEGLEKGMDAAVLSTSERAAAFEARQHSLTRMEAIKENWKSIMWCE